MSTVTNIILTTAVEDDGIDALNLLVNDREDSPFFQSGRLRTVDDSELPNGWYAGTKHLECEIVPAAYNNLVLADLVRLIESVKWEFPESVQLFVLEQDAVRFREIPLWGTASRT